MATRLMDDGWTFRDLLPATLEPILTRHTRGWALNQRSLHQCWISTMIGI